MMIVAAAALLAMAGSTPLQVPAPQQLHARVDSVSDAVGVATSSTASPVAARDTLRAPPALVNRSRLPGRAEFVLTAAPLTVSLIDGTTTEAWAYNATVPGPTIEVREGDRVVVRFRNELPEETTVHWHGLHLPFAVDGSPFHPVAPGAEAVFEFTVPPGSAGTYWYHPHPHHRTRYQVTKGLYGALVVRAREDPLEGVEEKLIILSDGRFLADGSIDLPARSTPQGRIDFENGWEGDVLFVNGQRAPVLDLRPGSVQRWRIINASAARVYRLAIPGHRLLHVGSDGGLFEHPVETDEILLASSERAEVLVRATGRPGAVVPLQSLPYDRYIPQTRPADWERTRDLLTIRYTNDPAVAAPPLPTSLRAVEWLDTTGITATRTIAMTQGFLNGRAMDMTRIDERTTLGATEIWQLENLVGMDHPFHLHGFRFQVLDRNGVPVDQPRWDDTVNVPKHESVRFVVRFDDFAGRWMFHCHILDHEENGMMGILEVSQGRQP